MAGAGRGRACRAVRAPYPGSAPSASQVLYQGLEKLEKEKANRAHLDMEIDVVRARGRGHPVCLGDLLVIV